MAEGAPPPLPPKQKSGLRSNMNNNEATPHTYSQEDVARALHEEELAFQRIKQQKEQLQKNLRPSRIDVSRSFSAGANDRSKPVYSSGSLSATPGISAAAITPPPVVQRSLKGVNAGLGVTASSSQDESEDLMSFRSPEKPKNDILDLFQSWNANNQRTVVPVSSSAIGLSLPGFPVHQQGPALTSCAFNTTNVPGTAVAATPAYPNKNITLLNNQAINSNLMSTAVPPIPNRNPVFIPNRISYFANQMYPGQCSTASPVSAAACHVPLHTSAAAQTQSINALSFKFNGNSQPTTFAYKPNIPLNIPAQASKAPEGVTASVGGVTSSGLCSASTASTVQSAPATAKPALSKVSPVEMPRTMPVLAKVPPVKQKRTGRKSEDLIDFGSSPARVPSTRPDDVDSLLYDFDPLVSRSHEPQVVKNATSKEGRASPAANGDDAFSVKVQGVVVLSYEASEMLRFKERNLLHAGEEDEASNYYEHVDPFEYMRPDGSCRSDPVYDAYDGLRSPTGTLGDTFDIPPPLPPRAATPHVTTMTTTTTTTTITTATITTATDTTTATATTTSGSKQPNISASGAHVCHKKEKTTVEGQWTWCHVNICKTNALEADGEAVHFWDGIKRLRESYSHDDSMGNPGLLHSPCLDGLLCPTLSVKLQIFYADRDPVVFTSNLDANVEHVVMQALVSLDLHDSAAHFLLKVRGVEEYLCGLTTLGESVYVHGCVKYDNDVCFTLLRAEDVPRPYLRTAEDDERVATLTVESLLPGGTMHAMHYDRLHIAIDQFERELRSLQQSGFLLADGTPLQDLPSPMRSSRVTQVVKQICAIAGNIVTLDISEAVTVFVESCRAIQKSQGILDGEEATTTAGATSASGGNLVTGSEDPEPQVLKGRFMDALGKLTGALSSFLSMYSRAFRVDFHVPPLVQSCAEPLDSSSVREQLAVKVRGLHRLSTTWQYDQYFVELQLYHGSRCVGSPQLSPTVAPTVCLRRYSVVPFNCSLDMRARVNNLPLESRLVLTVYGLRQLAAPDEDSPRYVREEVGWAALQCYSYDRKLRQGGHLLALWPMDCDRRLGAAPHSYDHPSAATCPLLCVELPVHAGEVEFPEVTPLPPQLLNFADLDMNTKQQLKDICERDIFTFNRGSAAEREVLWEKRHYLHHEPHALAKVLLAANSWDTSHLPDLHSMLLHWTALTPADALPLLLPSFGDTMVRTRAVEWLRGLGSDELLAYLPQLVQAVKHEAWDASAVVRLLLERSITCPRLAHHLYWLLNQCHPQQTNMSGSQTWCAQDARYRRRLQLVTRALLVICGANLECRLLRQEALLRALYATAVRIKDTKDAAKMTVLGRELETINHMLTNDVTSLPLSPALAVSGVEVAACAYFNSFTIPLKLAFRSVEPRTSLIHAIFKVGDDLRQDMLVIQMIRLMDRLWLRAGLDLKIVTFDVVPTGDRTGIIELVKDAETLRRIQTEYGVTGVFKDRPIAEWLARQNPSALEYQRAVENFTASCAGYCVATYILGICDRHNDNIMLKNTGHLFHIDFGKYLGDAQKFGNIKRDRTPFVLTADMAYVINGGEKPSDKFHSFVDLCCKAYNIIRTNGHLLLYLFALMASSGVGGVSWNGVKFVQEALHQDHSPQEAGAFFARMIQDSLKSWFTQVNFFIHNLAQLRFSNDPSSAEVLDPGSGQLLSFIPRIYTMNDDGRVSKVSVFSYQKRYNPTKYYVYILSVERRDHKEPSYLFRSWKEFSEFHAKLCVLFPFVPLHSLPRGVVMGRSEVSVVAQRRKMCIELFLNTLFSLADEVAHSDIVYTFLHPLLRDQEDTDIHITKLKKPETALAPLDHPSSIGRGQVKVGLQYRHGELQIMVLHARNLALLGTLEPSPYAKLYLLPDPTKRTKRKTRVCKKTCHPSFMEQITYRMALELVQQRTLEVAIWSEDMLRENSYLGSCYMPLTAVQADNEIVEWLSLEHNIRTARDHVLYST